MSCSKYENQKLKHVIVYLAICINISEVFQQTPKVNDGFFQEIIEHIALKVFLSI